MDSLTQIALGAAVGEAVAGRAVGRKAAVWGAVLGTLPDLDILAYPFLDPVGEMAFHRGLTHSLMFVLIASPVLGRALHGLHPGASRRRWGWLAALVIGTHILLDCFTVYGTQVFWPLSDYGISFDTIFIIDPLYTLPLLTSTIVALCFRADRPARRRWNGAGLALSTLYLAWTCLAKVLITPSFDAAWDRAGVEPERTMSIPTPFNSWLWIGMAEARDTLFVAVAGLSDSGAPDLAGRIPLGRDLIDGHTEDRAVARVLRFSKDWASWESGANGLRAHDWRFGRSDAWLSDSGDAIFQFALPSEDGQYRTFRIERPDFDDPGESLGRVWQRMGRR